MKDIAQSAQGSSLCTSILQMAHSDETAPQLREFLQKFAQAQEKTPIKIEAWDLSFVNI